MNTKSKGFTLIELIVAVAIVSILAAIAWPSYRNYVVKAARVEAKATMLNMAQMQERYYTNNGGYLSLPGPAGSSPSGWQDYSGSSLASRRYDITVTAGPSGALGTSFKISAAPSNGFTDATCGTLTLDSAGTKGSSIGNASPCW